MKAVLTTINPPNKVYFDLCENLGEKKVVVVGDKKTPDSWNDQLGYISIERQLDEYSDFAEELPFNHYCRKNIGYLEALKDLPSGEVLYETDDDTYLTDAAALARPEREGKYAPNNANARWINAYRFFSDERIWPRGLPLNYIIQKPQTVRAKNSRPVVKQFLVDGDPDVDAIFRLTTSGSFSFDKNLDKSIYVADGRVCPYNSQNTIHMKEAFPFLYLPSFVSFRMTDIWRSLIAQMYFAKRGWGVAFLPPNSIQERNEHDLVKDLSQELDGYYFNDLIIDICEKIEADDPLDYLVRSYTALSEVDVVPAKESALVAKWCDRLSAIY